MDTHITLNEAVLNKRVASLIAESRTLFNHAHAIAGIAIPPTAAAGAFVATAQQWRDRFGHATSTHADNLRESAEQVIAFARTAETLETRNAATFTTGSPS